MQLRDLFSMQLFRADDATVIRDQGIHHHLPA